MLERIPYKYGNISIETIPYSLTSDLIGESMTSRTLLYFPIVHSQLDMGALSESVRKVTLQKLGERVWRQKINLVKRFWSDVENILNKLTLSYAQTRVYQDGLPVCGKEFDIVTELAKKGSPNHQILVHLMEKGATVMGTESAELLIEEYHLIKRILETGDVKDAIAIETRQKSASDLLLKKRDEFIAARIDQTLQQGETGILFLGMLSMPVRRLGFLAAMFSRSESAGQRILEILDTESPVKEKPDAIKLGRLSGQVIPFYIDMRQVIQISALCMVKDQISLIVC